MEKTRIFFLGIFLLSFGINNLVRTKELALGWLRGRRDRRLHQWFLPGASKEYIRFRFSYEYGKAFYTSSGVILVASGLLCFLSLLNDGEITGISEWIWFMLIGIILCSFLFMFGYELWGPAKKDGRGNSAFNKSS